MSSSTSRFYCTRLNYEDLENILCFINKYYTDPGATTIGIKGEDHSKVLRCRVKANLRQNYAFGMFEKSNDKLIAVALNQIKEKHSNTIDDEIREFIPHVPSSYKSVLNLNRNLYGNVFEDLKTDKIYHLGIACVDAEYRRAGLLSEMLRYCEEDAVANRCKYITAIVASENVWKTGKTQKFNVLNQVRLKDFVDPETGLKPFQNVSPLLAHWRFCYKEMNLGARIQSKL